MNFVKLFFILIFLLGASCKKHEDYLTTPDGWRVYDIGDDGNYRGMGISIDSLLGLLDTRVADWIADAVAEGYSEEACRHKASLVKFHLIDNWQFYDEYAGAWAYGSIWYAEGIINITIFDPVFIYPGMSVTAHEMWHLLGVHHN